MCGLAKLFHHGAHGENPLKISAPFLQPAEWIGKTLVLYSLGNALFDQYGLENTRQSALVIVMFDSRGVKEFHAIPFLIDVPNSRIVQADDADAQAILNYFE